MTVDVNGIQLHWEETGDGEPLVWLHGAMGCGDDWRYVFREAPPGFRIIAPDLRGHGASTNPTGAFSFRQCALDVRALLEHLRLPRIKAIGVSGGGLTLLHLATLAPGLVESMVVVSAPPYFPPEARSIQRRFSAAMLGEAELARMRAVHRGGEPQIQQLFALVRGLADSYDDVNFTPPYLGTIAAHTLVVFGDRDPLYPVSLGFELHRSIPKSYLWVVPNGGHGPVFGELGPRFASVTIPFLRGEWKK